MITAPGTYAAWAREGRDTTKGLCTPAGWGWSLTTVLLGLLAGGRTWALRLGLKDSVSSIMPRAWDPVDKWAWSLLSQSFRLVVCDTSLSDCK